MVRCVIFSRADQIQALVELGTMDDAVAVRTTLDGLNIYPGANTLKVQSATAAGRAREGVFKLLGVLWCSD